MIAKFYFASYDNKRSHAEQHFFIKVDETKNNNATVKDHKLRAGFDPATFTLPNTWDMDNNEFWHRFQQYLTNNYSRNTVVCQILYAKKYAYVLRNTNAQDLLSLPDQKRMLVMKSLATLSKYLGCYDLWCDIRERYQLKWSTYDSLHIFHNMVNNQQNYSAMINWLKDTCSKLPKSYSNILLYNTLTGLRPTEACQSISLIHSDLNNYLKDDTMVLEHYKYPHIFIRKTKKSYISIVTETILNIAKHADIHSYNSIRMAIRKSDLHMHMAYCRKIFATHLRNDGIEQEIIDLLQGRAPKSVFSRHYFRPDFNHQRIRDSIESLFDKITV